MEYVPSRPPKKLGGKEADEVGTTTKMSQASIITFENTTQIITNLSKNEKVPNIGSMIKEHEITGVWSLRNGKHQVQSQLERKMTWTRTKGTFTMQWLLRGHRN